MYVIYVYIVFNHYYPVYIIIMYMYVGMLYNARAYIIKLDVDVNNIIYIIYILSCAFV